MRLYYRPIVSSDLTLSYGIMEEALYRTPRLTSEDASIKKRTIPKSMITTCLQTSNTIFLSF